MRATNVRCVAGSVRKDCFSCSSAAFRVAGSARKVELVGSETVEPSLRIRYCRTNLGSGHR